MEPVEYLEKIKKWASVKEVSDNTDYSVSAVYRRLSWWAKLQDSDIEKKTGYYDSGQGKHEVSLFRFKENDNKKTI